MSDAELERERMRMEVRRVEMAQLELEFKIKERQAEIARLQGYVEIQKQKALELTAAMDGVKNV